METQRQRDARVAEIYARVVWFGFHILVILLIVLPDTTLRQNILDRNYRQFVPFFGVVFVTVIVYLTVGFLDPGYQYPKTEGDKCSADPPQNVDEKGGICYKSKIRERRSPRGSCIIQQQESTISSHLTEGIQQSHHQTNRDSEEGYSIDGAEINWWLGNPAGKFCSYCGAWQPLRGKHCHDCNKCVRKFDHHCAFVGNCVGAGNHVVFWWYLGCQLVVILWAIQIIVSSLDVRYDRDVTTFYFPLVVAALILSFYLLFVGVIFFYHTFLIITNTTTYERERWSKLPYLQGVPESVHIFSGGVFWNVWLFCCRPNYKYSVPDNIPEMVQDQERETCFNNRYYSCC